MPNAVPRYRSSPTKTGIAAIKVKALLVSANELMRIGAKGWTFVKAIKTKTTIYSAAVHETNIIRQPYLSKKAPTRGVSRMGITPWMEEL